MNGKKVVCLKTLDFRGAEWPSVSSSFTVSGVRFAKSLGSLWDVCHSIVQDQELIEKIHIPPSPTMTRCDGMVNFCVPCLKALKGFHASKLVHKIQPTKLIPRP